MLSSPSPCRFNWLLAWSARAHGCVYYKTRLLRFACMSLQYFFFLFSRFQFWCLIRLVQVFVECRWRCGVEYDCLCVYCVLTAYHGVDIILNYRMYIRIYVCVFVALPTSTNCRCTCGWCLFDRTEYKAANIESI